VQRNFGVAIAYMTIALQSLLKGLSKLQVNQDNIRRDVAENWEVLGEAVQTVMRRYGIPEPYEKLKALTRGRTVDRSSLHDFINSLEIPDEAKSRLLNLTPSTYTGLAARLTRHES
jgi:adenylosuccinate lyase